jgi:hypothetical protein
MKRILWLVSVALLCTIISSSGFAQKTKPLMQVQVKTIITDPLKYDFGKPIPEVDITKLNLSSEQIDKLTKLRETLQEAELKYQRTFSDVWNKQLKPAAQKNDQGAIDKIRDQLLNNLRDLQKARISYYFDMQKVLTQEQLKQFPILFTKEQVDKLESLREAYDKERLNLDIARMIEGYKVQKLREENASTKEINTRVALIIAIDNKKKDDQVNYMVSLREVLTKEQKAIFFPERK